jgi:hypothetical protein
MFRVVPIGGLGNRIRSILSHRAAHGEIEVLWARSDAVCRGRWEDVFEPLSGVTFSDIGEIHAHDYKGPHDAMYEQIASGEPEGWTRCYAELVPSVDVMVRVADVYATLKRPMDPPTHLGPPNYYAVHARRGDHTEHAKLFGHCTTNEELLWWCTKRISDFPYTVFLATDCPDTQEWFRARLPHFVRRTLVQGVSGYEQRPGTLAEAVVDMWVCTHSIAFKGSWMSSYSETIELIRHDGVPRGGFELRHHMPSGDAEYYRGRPDRALERLTHGYDR